ncbi:MAG: replication initiator protein [Microviridae sp.]|nr:MAG: replication initiator protein [Microviridae sp.]
MTLLFSAGLLSIRLLCKLVTRFSPTQCTLFVFVVNFRSSEFPLFNMKCDDPFFVYARTGDRVPIRCGKCPPCKLERVNSWVFRLMEEEKRHDCAHFITLTYDTSTVPITENGFMTLRKKDTQDFWKRLRKAHPDLNVKYYLVGEYGTKNNRPHYHAIVFGVPDTQYYADAWSIFGTQLGSLHVGSVTGDSIAYCLKYIDKPHSRRHKRDDREKEFNTSSQGLDVLLLSDTNTSWRTTKAVIMCVQSERQTLVRSEASKPKEAV